MEPRDLRSRFRGNQGLEGAELQGWGYGQVTQPPERDKDRGHSQQRVPLDSVPRSVLIKLLTPNFLQAQKE